MGVQFAPVRQCRLPCECMQQTQGPAPHLPGRGGHFLLGSTFVPCTMAPLYSYLFTRSPFPLPCQQRPCFIYLCIGVVCLAPCLGLQGTPVREHTEWNKCSLRFQKGFTWLRQIPVMSSLSAAVPSLSPNAAYLNSTLLLPFTTGFLQIKTMCQHARST